MKASAVAVVPKTPLRLRIRVSAALKSRLASVRPMSSGAGIEWLPDVGVPWHVVHGPGSVSMPESSFSPLTSVIWIGLELKRISHRATAARAAFAEIA